MKTVLKKMKDGSFTFAESLLNGVNAAPRFLQIDPYAGEFERRRSAFGSGGLGVGATRVLEVPSRSSASRQPPDPGSASARKIATH
jgi:hypothetical protein